MVEYQTIQTLKNKNRILIRVLHKIKMIAPKVLKNKLRIQIPHSF